MANALMELLLDIGGTFFFPSNGMSMEMSFRP